jgi:hypothetical protein
MLSERPFSYPDIIRAIVEGIPCIKLPSETKVQQHSPLCGDEEGRGAFSRGTVTIVRPRFVSDVFAVAEVLMQLRDMDG